MASSWVQVQAFKLTKANHLPAYKEKKEAIPVELAN
jgi:hypothetical protein